MRYVLFQGSYYDPANPEDREYGLDIRDFADDTPLTPAGFAAADVFERMPVTHTLVACFDSRQNQLSEVIDGHQFHCNMIYRLTQNARDSWSQSERVGLVTAVQSLETISERRGGLGSTCAGDVILCETGEAWLVSSRGFKELGKAPTGMTKVFQSFPDGFIPAKTMGYHEFIARQSNLLRQALGDSVQPKIADAEPDFACENCLGLSFAPCYCKAHGAVGPGDPAAPIAELVVATPAAPVAVTSRRGPR